MSSHRSDVHGLSSLQSVPDAHIRQLAFISPAQPPELHLSDVVQGSSSSQSCPSGATSETHCCLVSSHEPIWQVIEVSPAQLRCLPEVHLPVLHWSPTVQ